MTALGESLHRIYTPSPNLCIADAHPWLEWLLFDVREKPMDVGFVLSIAVLLLVTVALVKGCAALERKP